MSGNMRLLILVLWLLSLNSCFLFEKEDPEPDGEEEEIHIPMVEVELLTDSLHPTQQVVLQIVWGEELEYDTMNAHINGKELVFTVTDTLTLVGNIPRELNAGQFEIYSAHLVSRPVIVILEGVVVEDPEAFIDEFATSVFDDINENFSPVTDPELYTYFQEKWSEIQVQIDELTKEEKELLAATIANNMSVVDDLQDALALYDENFGSGRLAACGAGCHFASFVFLSGVAAVSLSALTVGIGVGLVAVLASKSIETRVQSALTRYKERAKNFFGSSNSWLLGAEQSSFQSDGDDLFNGFGRGGRASDIYIRVIDGKYKRLHFRPTYRTLSRDDAESSDPELSKLVKTYLSISDYWTTTMPSSFGEMPSLEASTFQSTARNPDGLRVEVVSSSDGFDRITIPEQGGTTEEYAVVFDSEDDSDQELIFKVIYEEEGEVLFEEVLTADFWSLDYDEWHAARTPEERKLFNYLAGNGPVTNVLSVPVMQYLRQEVLNIEVKDNIGLTTIGGLDLFKNVALLEIQNNSALTGLIDFTDANLTYYGRVYIVNCPVSAVNFGTHSFYSAGFEGTQLTSVDVSNRDLRYLNFYNNPNLSTVTGLNSVNRHGDWVVFEATFHSNKIISLDLSFSAITRLTVVNEPIQSINFTEARELGQLEIRECAQLNSIELNNIDSLMHAVITDNATVSEFTLSGAPELYYLALSNNNISTLELKNFPKLITLSINRNNLSSIDLMGTTNIQSLSAYSNKFSSLPICGLSSLTHVSLGDNEFSESALQTLIDCLGEQVVSYDCTSYASDECPEQ